MEGTEMQSKVVGEWNPVGRDRRHIPEMRQEIWCNVRNPDLQTTSLGLQRTWFEIETALSTISHCRRSSHVDSMCVITTYKLITMPV